MISPIKWFRVQNVMFKLSRQIPRNIRNNVERNGNYKNEYDEYTEKTLHYCNKALEIHPGYIDAYIKKLCWLKVSQRYREAIETGNKVKILFPKVKWVNLLCSLPMAASHLYLGDEYAAERLLEEALSYDSKFFKEVFIGVSKESVKMYLESIRNGTYKE
ncbi:MAG: hypothetical protein GY754_01085 [bacterium]|nr:hypothetical protein [bacterium]